MGSFSIWHWVIVLVVVLVLFGGGGKISRIMGDFGKGLKSFKKGMKEDEEDVTEPLRERKSLEAESSSASKTESVAEKDGAAKG
ncbi:MAG: hypothetical protein A3G18_01205 [Rhodospirillales bacterium RIFCSPLOWO2_12_FULL_58_28]|nr:MAG: hypothetical protein A3H92_04405 [Rhodospirillales bacterium RIFCSPLOWO2_02_FULL_58_16]OHC78021.1 MAG: hypothetical protein A3G18_01205 [Rhodospirillales bacterium RIFCSPLOWO2_12_FULL_58_28]